MLVFLHRSTDPGVIWAVCDPSSQTWHCYDSRVMWVSITETYRWSAHTSSSFVIYWCWHIFCVENILEFEYCFWLFTDVDYFSCAKSSYHSRLMFMWFSVTETYRWSGWTSSSFVTYWCWTYFLCGKYSTISILLLIIYWCWLFFMCKMFLSFSTDVYVIFCYWNILMKWMDFIFICDWHIFCVENILWFEYCFWLFTDVD